MENDSILTDDKDIAKTMNNIFINITKNLNLKPHKDSTLTDINGITSNFDNHIIMKKIKESFPNTVFGDLIFRRFLCRMLINLNVKKSPTNWCIPAIILKQYVDVHLPFLTKAINRAITEKLTP